MAAPESTQMAAADTTSAEDRSPEVLPTQSRLTKWILAILFEAALIATLLMTYRWIRYLLDGQIAKADANARWIWHTERLLHLPSEITMQHWALAGEPVARLCNLYYFSAHFPATAVMLAWLFIFKRSAYPRVRLELTLLTACGLVLQALFPLTPPRLAALGFVDTMRTVGPSTYPDGDQGIANQHAAMPSLHVGWAILVAIVVTRVAITKWRWLVWIHPTLTVFVVVVTANHYWLDGVAATALLLGVIGCVSSRIWKPTEELQASMATSGS